MKCLLFIVVTLFSSVAFGQKNPKLSFFVSQCVIKGTKGEAYAKTKKNFAHVYSIAISFDNRGKIDTLYYSSKLNPETKAIFSLDNSLLKRIKAYDLAFSQYVSKIVLIPFYFYNATDDAVNYDSGFLNSMANMMPEAIDGKPVIVLSPVVDAGLPPIR